MRYVITVSAITVPEDPLSKGSGCLTAHIYFIVAPPSSYPSAFEILVSILLQE